MKKILVFLFLVMLLSCQTQELSPNPQGSLGISDFTREQTKTGEILFASGSHMEMKNNLTTQTGIISEDSPQPVQTSDQSITKYVNDKIHYDDIEYTPDDLEKITGKYILDTKGNQTLRKEANLHLQELSKAFYEKFQVQLKIVSAYRSYGYQVGIKKGGCSDLFCAKAGYSEHQSGLAFDMFEATSQKEFLSKKDLKKYFEWMKENAHTYGFHNSYQKGKEIDGYAIEPWHWRYLGVDFATQLKEINMTYAEYYKIHGQK